MRGWGWVESVRVGAVGEADEEEEEEEEEARFDRFLVHVGWLLRSSSSV